MTPQEVAPILEASGEAILVKVLAVMGHRLRADLEAVREREAKTRKR